MNHGPIEKKYEDSMRALATAIDEILNGTKEEGKKRKTGFALLMFDFEVTEGSRTNYISNTNRRDMILAMKEFIARAEGRITDAENVQ